MARYRKVDIRMWNDQSFKALSRPQPNGQSLFQYLITGDCTNNIPGCFAIGEAGLAERLDWPLEGLRDAMREVLGQAPEKGCIKPFVKVDWKARFIFVPNAIKYNFPNSANVVTSWAETWDELPECSLKVEAYHHIKDFMYAKSEAIHDAFVTACHKPSFMVSPIQEQEQDQDQKQEKKPPKGCMSPEGDTAISSVKDVLAMWNGIETAKPVKFEHLTPDRGLHKRITVLTRNAGKQPLDWWRETMQAVEEQKLFLFSGANPKQWTATLAWVLGPENLAKVRERRYLDFKLPVGQPIPNSLVQSGPKPGSCNWHHDGAWCDLPVLIRTGNERRCGWHRFLDQHADLPTTPETFEQWLAQFSPESRTRLLPKDCTSAQAWHAANRGRRHDEHRLAAIT